MAEHVTLTPRPNATVADAIRAHHSELAVQLRARTAALAAAGRGEEWLGPCADLHRWYQTELLPHAVAEERTLYAAGADLDATRLLVRAMLAEHQALIGLIARLAHAGEPWEALAAATSAETLFGVHLAKENELLLPALDAAGVALAPLLEGMHEILGHGATPDPERRGTGGCGCAGGG